MGADADARAEPGAVTDDGVGWSPAWELGMEPGMGAETGDAGASR